MRSSAGLVESNPHPWSQTVAPTVAGFGVAVTEAPRPGLGAGFPARTGAVASAATTTTAAIVTNRILRWRKDIPPPFNTEALRHAALCVPYRHLGRFARSLTRWNQREGEEPQVSSSPFA